MDPDRCRRLMTDQQMAYLATIGANGPQQVPIVFAVGDDTIVTAVDFKPKRTRHLQRLANIEHDPRVSVLADHYDDDWSQLWWVRADCSALVVESGSTYEAAIGLLVDKYHQYQATRPMGPAVIMTVNRWSGWRADPE